LTQQIRRLLADPGPAYAFEISEGGIAWAALGDEGPLRSGFERFTRPTLEVSPLKDNILDADLLGDTIEKIALEAPAKRRTAALILPDYCGRIMVLDFDTFPSKTEEREALVKFRMKKSVPYDIDTAAVSFAVQHQDGKRFEIVAAVVALEIVARYETVFHSHGFHTGLVTTSSIAALDLINTPGVAVAARLSGRTLSVSVVEDGRIKLVRCVELPDVTREEMEGVLIPTLAYIEDELKARPETLLVCGFGTHDDEVSWLSEFGLKVEPLRSRLGTPTQQNAGLLGYLERSEAA
jgi:type IV pilus assembly protein PilM